MDELIATDGERRVYRVRDGFVIADQGGWWPGLYADEAAARMAFETPEELLIELRDRGPEPITVGALRGAL